MDASRADSRRRRRSAHGTRIPNHGRGALRAACIPIRTPAVAATGNGRLAPERGAGIGRVKRAKSIGGRAGDWLSLRQAQALLNAPDITTTEGLARSRHGRPRRVFRRDEAILLRKEGLSWRVIAKRLEVAVTTMVDACRCSEIALPEAPIPGGKTKGKRKAA